MILITQLYNNNKIRFAELMFALKKNIENKFIEKIILLNEKILNLDISNNKIQQVNIKKRLTYKIAFDYARDNLEKNKIIILSNSDIWFDNTLSKINNFNMNRTVLALSRYEKKKNGKYAIFHKNTSYTQDCWIFKNPINIDFPHNIQLGRGGCDNRIAWIISKSKINKNHPKKIKYSVLNPAKKIKAYHEHASKIRNWKCGEIKGPYLHINIS